MEFTADQEKKISKLAMQKFSDFSYSAFMKCLRQKDIKVNGKRVKEDIILKCGDVVEIFYKVLPKEKYSVIYQDENVFIINKKSGYSSEEIFSDVLSKNGNAFFIHRLDRNTSGIMVFALNNQAEKELLLGFKKRTFTKKYLATVYGKMEKTQDVLTAYLVKDSESASVKVYDSKVKDSVQIKTGYKVLKEEGESSLLSITLYTGKTHQIRAHLAHIGHFILGDGKYGDNRINEKLNVKKQMLVSNEITFSFTEKESLYYLNGKTFGIEG